MKSWLRTRTSSESIVGKFGQKQTRRPGEKRNSPHIWTTDERDLEAASVYHQYSSALASQQPQATVAKDPQETSSIREGNEQEAQLEHFSSSSSDKVPSLYNSSDINSTQSSVPNILLSSECNIVDLDKPLAQVRILVTSEHYFRLVCESYEQLKAAHYKASQEFSLAEWLHVHAILFYGRIQQIHKKLSSDSANVFDIKWDPALLVFTPIARVLDAIGRVEDSDSGIVYLPDAVLPKELLELTEDQLGEEFSHSSEELQRILDGTLYDWSRSWKRVQEARSERLRSSNQFKMTRSESELIMLIQKTSESLSQIKAKQPKLDAFMEDDGAEDQELLSTQDSSDDVRDALESIEAEIETQERLLARLSEEARNAKDYTLRQPCERMYNERFTPFTHISKPSYTKLSLECKTFSPARRHEGKSYETVPVKAKHTAKHSTAKSQDLFYDLSRDTSGLDLNLVSPLLNPEESDTSQDLLDESKDVLSGLGTKHTQNFFTDDNLNTVSGLGTTEKPVALQDNSGEPTIQKRSILRKPAVLRISKVPPFQPSPVLTNAPITTSKLTEELEIAQNTPTRIVQGDHELWHSYANFVQALNDRGSAHFNTLDSSVDGTYAWLICVKMDRHGTGKNPILVMPRRSIPLEDQKLALVMQTCSPKEHEVQSWHLVRSAEVDMRTFMSGYITDSTTNW